MSDWGESELRELCARLIAGAGEHDDERELARAPELRQEVERRLAAVGVRLWRQPDQPPRCLLEDDRGLSEHSRAALAFCALRLHPGLESSSRRRPRLSVSEIGKALPGSYTDAYLRRAVLGPLGTRELIKVVKPEQRASQAYVVAGPLLGAIDLAALQARLPPQGVQEPLDAA